MQTAIYAGSFDPFTNGHLDILKRGTEIFDKVIIAVAYDNGKKSFIPPEIRIKLIKESVKEFKNVEVDSYEGLTVEYAKKNNASVLLRGVRTSADFEYEMQLSQINKTLCGEIETLFLPAKPEFSIISSSAVREIYKAKGDFSKFVPYPVYEYLNGN